MMTIVAERRFPLSMSLAVYAEDLSKEILIYAKAVAVFSMRFVDGTQRTR
jgi:hypothetical protein